MVLESMYHVGVKASVCKDLLSYGAERRALLPLCLCAFEISSLGSPDTSPIPEVCSMGPTLLMDKWLLCWPSCCVSSHLASNALSWLGGSSSCNVRSHGALHSSRKQSKVGPGAWLKMTREGKGKEEPYVPGRPSGARI